VRGRVIAQGDVFDLSDFGSAISHNHYVSIARREKSGMRKFVAITAVVVATSIGQPMQGVLADQAPVSRSIKKVRHVCHAGKCGPHTPCGWRCRVPCPDPYSCYSLYGAYGPYGGSRFWGAYTYSGWGHYR
jgi:hypothetical protein